MKIIRPYAKILSPWNFAEAGSYLGEETDLSNPELGFDISSDALRFIEWCSRISHRAEDKQTRDSWKRFVQSVVIDHGDWSVVEHVSVSVDAVVDRGITHEWVRHRLFSFTQESTRFVNYEKKMVPSFIYPQVDVECPRCLQDDSAIEDTFRSPTTGIVIGRHKGGEECRYDWYWRQCIEQVELGYKVLLQEKKWRPQEARSVFPNALASRIVVTGNLRNWRHFLIMRTSIETHPQFRQVTIPLLKEFQTMFPILFDDIVPNQKQSEAIKKAR